MLKRLLAWILSLTLLALPVAAAEVSSGFNLPATGAKGAVLMEASSGRVLWEQNSQQLLPIASTTKIMTAILTLEQPELDSYFTVDPVAIHVEGTSMGLQEGDSVSLRVLVWGMLLASGNDAANSAAIRISGNLPAFVDLMNQKAKQLGMYNTHFESPSGLDVGEHHSTAYDMALLARYALQNDAFVEISSAKNKKLQYGNPPYDRWLKNHNRLLWDCADCIGIKTGFTKKAGRCLVSAAQREGLTLIAVTLGCPDDFSTHHALYDYAFSRLRFVDVSPLLERLSIPITGAEQQQIPLKALAPLGAFLTDAESASCAISVEVPPFVYAPLVEGEPLGRAVLTLNGIEVSSVMVLAGQDRPARFIERRSIIERIVDFYAYPQNYRFPLNEREKEQQRENTQSPGRSGDLLPPWS